MLQLWHYVSAVAAAAMLAPSAGAIAGCDDAEDSAVQAYTYAKSALAESNLDTAHSLMLQAHKATEEAMSHASDCGCDEAEGDSDDASTFAQHGSNAAGLEEVHDYAQRTMNAAKQAQADASSCY